MYKIKERKEREIKEIANKKNLKRDYEIFKRAVY